MIDWLNGEYFLTALAICIACIVFAVPYKKRVGIWLFTVVSVGNLAVQSIVTWLLTYNMDASSDASIGAQMARALVYAVLIFAYTITVCNITLVSACIRSLFILMSAELVWGIAMFLHYLIIVNYGTLTTASYWIIVAIVFPIIFSVFFFVERKLCRKSEYLTENWGKLIPVLIITAICSFLSNINKVFKANDLLDLWINTLGYIPRFTYILIGIFIMYVIRIWKAYQVTVHELEMINDIFEKQKNQYEQAKINADVINQRYHDLKNQIAIIKADIPAQRQQAWLNDLEKKVEEIEPERLTDNPVLDTILWEKNQYCRLNDIKLSYVLNGRLFDNIDVDDLCVLFGSALDNAIEAVLKINDHDRRLIHVKAMKQQGFLAVCVENINDTPLKFVDGRITTSKKDKDRHGYGIKGIKYIAEKYGGDINIAQDDGWFRLTVMLGCKV